MKFLFNIRSALWCSVVMVAVGAIFIPLWFETEEALPAEWAEEINIPPLDEEEVSLASNTINAPEALVTIRSESLTG